MVRFDARVDILRYGFADKFLNGVKSARYNTQITTTHQNDGDTQLGDRTESTNLTA